MDQQDMMDTEDMVDLGRELPSLKNVPEVEVGTSPAADSPRINYPSIFLTLDKPIDFPKGKFMFVAVGELGKETMDHKDGKFSYDLEIHALKPCGPVDEGDTGESADNPLDSADVLEQKIMADKNKA